MSNADLIAEVDARREFYYGAGRYEAGSEIDLMFGLADALKAADAKIADAWDEGAKRQWLYGARRVPNEHAQNPYR